MSTNDATTNTTTTELIAELEHQADQNGEDEDLVIALNATIASLSGLVTAPRTAMMDLIAELEHQVDQNGEDEDLVVALNTAIAVLTRQAAASVVQGPR